MAGRHTVFWVHSYVPCDGSSGRIGCLCPVTESSLLQPFVGWRILAQDRTDLLLALHVLYRLATFFLAQLGGKWTSH